MIFRIAVLLTAAALAACSKAPEPPVAAKPSATEAAAPPLVAAPAAAPASQSYENAGIAWRKGDVDAAFASTCA